MSARGAGPGIRLQKVLARAGIASRRAAERLIEAGRVRVDGRIARFHLMVQPFIAQIKLAQVS